MRFVIAYILASLFITCPGRTFTELCKLKTTLILPCFAFKKNSTELMPCSNGYKTSHPDSTLFYLKNLLTKNPTIIIKIAATAYDEQHMRRLSQHRAKAIKKKLIGLGIPAGRIVAKGTGNSDPLIDSDTISKAATTEEKEQLKSENRRAYFVVLSWDYKVKPRDKKTKT